QNSRNKTNRNCLNRGYLRAGDSLYPDRWDHVQLAGTDLSARSFRKADRPGWRDRPPNIPPLDLPKDPFLHSLRKPAWAPLTRSTYADQKAYPALCRDTRPSFWRTNAACYSKRWQCAPQTLVLTKQLLHFPSYWQ